MGSVSALGGPTQEVKGERTHLMPVLRFRFGQAILLLVCECPTARSAQAGRD
jgi:hypothetical protein